MRKSRKKQRSGSAPSVGCWGCRAGPVRVTELRIAGGVSKYLETLVRENWEQSRKSQIA
jgi:hypothetical protein